MTVAFALPRTQHRAVALAGIDLNWSAAQVMREAIDEWLARHPARRVAR